MNMASEYKKVALEILREYLEIMDNTIFDYSGNFKESAAELKEKAMGYLERLGEGEDAFNKLSENLLIANYYEIESEAESNGRGKP